MRVDDILWLPRFVDKIESKHGVLPEEVEEVFCNRPLVISARDMDPRERTSHARK